MERGGLGMKPDTSTFTRDLFIAAVVIISLSIGLMSGSKVSTYRAEQRCQIAIANAVSNVESPLNCKDNEIIEAITNMALNGVHLQGYRLEISIGNIPDGMSLE